MTSRHASRQFIRKVKRLWVLHQACRASHEACACFLSTVHISESDAQAAHTGRLLTSCSSSKGISRAQSSGRKGDIRRQAQSRQSVR